MGIFSHVRFRFWDAERYTEAQAQEFRALRAAYLTHLGEAFGTLPPVLQLRDAKNVYYPAWTPPVNTLPVSPPPRHTAPLQSFSETLLGMLEVYGLRRAGRRYRKGHANDPLRLWALDLQDKCQALATAPLDQSTLNQVIALQRYLEALQRQSVFSQEPTGQGSVDVLLRNVLATLALMEDRVRYEIALSGAREHLGQLKSGVVQVLQETTEYLFYAVADKPRQHLRYSLLAAQAELVDEEVTASLQTRQGTLLKNLLHDPVVVRTALPQGNTRQQSVSPAISLLGGDTPTPFVDDKGQAETRWLDFLHCRERGAAQLNPSLKPLPSGICPLFMSTPQPPDEKAGETDPLAQFITLHGLLLTLAHYHDYVQHCWQLAGLGGDSLLYDRLAEALVSILSELQTFHVALREHLESFQQQLDSACTQAVKTNQHKAWQQNYHQAKVYQQRALAQLTQCESAVMAVITHAKDAGARQKRGALAAEAEQRLQGAGLFLNQARRQIGLPAQEHYPGLTGSPSHLPASGTYPANFLTEFDPLLLALVPQQTAQVARLGQLCREKPRERPWSIFQGSRQRYEYLENPARLAEIAHRFAALRASPAMSAAEKKEGMADLRRRIDDEQKLIERLKAGLWWPAHRASRQFFADWESILNNGLAQLGLWERTQDTVQSAGISGVQVVLPTDGSSPPKDLLALVSDQSWDRLPASALLPPEPEPLSVGDEKNLAAIYQQYQQCPFPEHKAAFETWQRTRFGGLLWESDGQLLTGLKLTQADASDIVDEWAQQHIKQGDDVMKQYAEVLVKGAEAIRRFDEMMRQVDTVLTAFETPIPLEEAEDTRTYPSLD